MENRQVKLMGVVNVNGDSFFAGSRAEGVEAFIERVESLFARGVDIIDVGAVSSRPGAGYVTAQEEWRRLEPVLSCWAQRFDRVGPFLVNDISLGSEDPNLLPTVSFLSLPYVAMHRRGTFATMHEDWHYDDVTAEVLAYFRAFSDRADALGIDWTLDPGIGFSKSSEEGLTLLRNLGRFRDEFHRPILVGVADKRITALVPQEELHRIAVAGGATILRIH